MTFSGNDWRLNNKTIWKIINPIWEQLFHFSPQNACALKSNNQGKRVTKYLFDLCARIVQCFDSSKARTDILIIIFKNILISHRDKTIFIPLRAKQVSEANLRSEQGGINFTPFVLSLPYAKKKKKKIKIFHMDGGQLKNVCLLSVCCLSVCCLLSVTSSSPIIFWTVFLIGLKFFSQKLEKMCIWEF